MNVIKKNRIDKATEPKSRLFVIYDGGCDGILIVTVNDHNVLKWIIMMMKQLSKITKNDYIMNLK